MDLEIKMSWDPRKNVKLNKWLRKCIFRITAAAATSITFPCSAHYSSHLCSSAFTHSLSPAFQKLVFNSILSFSTMKKKKRETKRRNNAAAVLRWILFTRHYLLQFPLLSAIFAFLLFFAAFSVISPLPPIINQHRSSQVLSLPFRFSRSWMFVLFVLMWDGRLRFSFYYQANENDLLFCVMR